MCKSNEVSILTGQIEKAFSWRRKPDVLTSNHELTADELFDVIIFSKISWQETTSSLWEKHFDVIHFFIPEAFKYFLPGILKASIVDNTPSLIVCEDLISSLNRSPNYHGWETYFLERWEGLTIDEYDVLDEWLLWQSNFVTSQEESMSLSIAMRTLEILKNKAKKIW